VLAGLFAGAALISGFTILRGGAEFDEGVVLAAAQRVAAGEMPYRDFLWPYGPAQPYLLGAWFELLGPSLLSWRILRVLCDAALAVTLYVLARREAPPRLALVGWLAAACLLAQPTSASPFPFALLASLLGLGLVTRRRPGTRDGLTAGALIALGAAWRLDFAVYGAAGVLTALLLRPGGRARLALEFAAAAVGLTALVYLPFALAAGPADIWNGVIGNSLRERDWWTLPFPISYDGGLSNPAEAKDLLDFYVPLAALVGYGLTALACLLQGRVAWRCAGLLVTSLGLVAYLYSRADEFHVAPLAVALAAAIPLALPRAPRPLAAALAAVLALLLLHGLAGRGSALLDPPRLEAIRVPAADGVQAPPKDARAIERTVAALQRLVPPGEPMHAVTQRSDLVAYSDPRIYVLAERPNVVRFDFGLLARAGVQRETVAALRRRRPRAIVRWLDPLSVKREANRRGEPTGSRLLDRHLADRYRPVARYGDYEILVPR
jgi:hypothetical protein